MSCKFTAASSQGINLPEPMITIGNGAGTQFTGLTIMAWIKFQATFSDADIADQIIFTIRRNTPTTSELLALSFWQTGGKLNLQSRYNTADNPVFAGSRASWTAGVWYHVAATMAQNSAKIYEDGALANTELTWAMNDDDMPNVTGVAYERANNTRYANYSMAELKIWKNRALTLEQINIERIRKGITFYPSDVKCYLPFMNNSLPANYIDFSQTGNNGAPLNTPVVDDHPPLLGGIAC